MITTKEFMLAVIADEDKIVEQYMTEQRQLAVEEALRSLPGVVHSLVLNTARIKDTKDKFFEQNKDLLERKEFFLKTLEETESKNPGVDYPQLLQNAAAEVRKKLKALNLGDTPEHRKPPLEELDHLTNMFEVDK